VLWVGGAGMLRNDRGEDWSAHVSDTAIAIWDDGRHIGLGDPAKMYVYDYAAAQKMLERPIVSLDPYGVGEPMIARTARYFMWTKITLTSVPENIILYYVDVVEWAENYISTTEWAPNVIAYEGVGDYVVIGDLSGVLRRYNLTTLVDTIDTGIADEVRGVAVKGSGSDMACIVAPENLCHLAYDPDAGAWTVTRYTSADHGVADARFLSYNPVTGRYVLAGPDKVVEYDPVAKSFADRTAAVPITTLASITALLIKGGDHYFGGSAGKVVRVSKDWAAYEDVTPSFGVDPLPTAVRCIG